jgi:hypothetical protein
MHFFQTLKSNCPPILMTVHKKQLSSRAMLITSEWMHEILTCILNSQRCTITLSLGMTYSLVPSNRIRIVYVVTKICNWKMLRNATGKCFLPIFDFYPHSSLSLFLILPYPQQINLHHQFQKARFEYGVTINAQAKNTAA